MNGVLNVAKCLRKIVVPRISAVTKSAFSSKNLLYTNIGISASLSGCGDFIEQQFEILTGKIENVDMTRTFHMSISGVSVGVICHYWYGFLDKKLPGYSINVVCKKILLDQIIGSPLCISAFFITLAVLDGNSFKEFKSEFAHKGWRLYLGEWILWTPAQFINFYFLPGKYRVLYDNCVSLVSDVYFSHVKHQSTSEKVS